MQPKLVLFLSHSFPGSGNVAGKARRRLTWFLGSVAGNLKALSHHFLDKKLILTLFLPISDLLLRTKLLKWLKEISGTIRKNNWKNLFHLERVDFKYLKTHKCWLHYSFCKTPPIDLNPPKRLFGGVT